MDNMLENKQLKVEVESHLRKLFKSLDNISGLNSFHYIDSDISHIVLNYSNYIVYLNTLITENKVAIGYVRYKNTPIYFELIGSSFNWNL